MELFPPIEPYERGLLAVGDGNVIAWEVSGAPDGKPAVVLHGGPGQGSAPTCIERMPSGYSGLPMPLHQVGMVAMGLWILDNPDIEALYLACAAERRSAFALVVAPLRLPGGTASAVNPLALF